MAGSTSTEAQHPASRSQAHGSTRAARFYPPRSLAMAMVLQYAVGGSIIPFITVFLLDRGLSVAQASHILMWSSAALLVSPFFWGMLADRKVPLNRLFALMNMVAAGALFVFVAQTTFSGFLVAFTAFYACYQPAPMLVNALCFRHLVDPVEEFAPLRAWGSVGWVLPSLPIFLWLALAAGVDYGFVPYLTIALSLGMAGLSFALPHTPPGAARKSPETPVGLAYWSAMRRLFRNTNYLVVLASYFLVSASFALQAFYAPPRMVELGLARSWVGPVQGIGVGMEILLFLWRAPLVHRMSYAGSVLIGCLCLVARQLIFAFGDNLWVLAASHLLVGTTVVFYHIGISLLVDEIAGPEVKATAQTLLVLCSSGFGPVCANWAVGHLAGRPGASLQPVFLVGAMLAALASLLIAARGRKLARGSRHAVVLPATVSVR